MKNADDLKKELNKKADPKQAKLLQGFFKTGPGQYGEGDIFLGLKVPQTREIAKRYTHLSLSELRIVLNSKIHEERLAALLILVEKFKKAENKEKKSIFDFYLNNTKNINNWDLVDLSSHKIVGVFLFDKKRDVLYKLAKSKNIWERRISVISTFHFINKGDFEDALKIAKILLSDSHDLIHKAVGWMLREVGKRNLKLEEEFLIKYYSKMPRTMLRYAIEKFPEKRRKMYLLGQIF